MALTVLVPLLARGHLTRANTLLNIAGTNITSRVDTLATAVLLGFVGVLLVVPIILVALP